MRIAVLALEGLFDTGLTVTLDSFSTANSLSAKLMGGTPHYYVTVVGVRRKVRSGLGLTMPVNAIAPDLKPDWVIVPALNATTPATLAPMLLSSYPPSAETDDLKGPFLYVQLKTRWWNSEK